MNPNYLDALRDLDAQRLDRRGFLKALTVLAASAGVTLISQSCGPATPAAPRIGGNLNACVWQGYDDTEVAKPFTEKHGVTVSGTYISSNEECFIKEKAAPGSFDLIGINMTYAEAFHQAGLILPVDQNVVTTWSDLIETLRNQPYINYDNQAWLVPSIWGSVGVNYNPEFVELPETFEFRDVAFDDQFKGKITFPDDPAGMLILIGIMNGFENPTRITREQLEQNVELGIELKQQTVAIGATYTDVVDMLVRGDAWICLAGWEAVNKWAADAGATLAYGYPTHAWSWCDGWMVGKNSKNVDTAWHYINQMTSPEAMALLTANLFSAPANKKAYPLLKPELTQIFALEKLEPALARSPVRPIPPNESAEYSTMSEWQAAWEKIKSA